MTLRAFTTAASNTSSTPVKDREKYELEVDERKVTFVKADENQIALLLAASQSGRLSEAAASLINFFFSTVLSEEDKAYFKGRLWDSSDPFGVEVMEDIMMFLIEEWTGRPTRPSSDSTGLLPSTGDGSTEKPRLVESNPSDSGPTASAP